jgi:hypothetical protein
MVQWGLYHDRMKKLPKRLRMSELSEKALDYLEAHIPELAELAFKQAYWAALASGSSVLIGDEEGNLSEVFPDGTRKLIQKLPPWTPVTPGKKMEIR